MLAPYCFQNQSKFTHGPQLVTIGQFQKKIIQLKWHLKKGTPPVNAVEQHRLKPFAGSKVVLKNDLKR